MGVSRVAQTASAAAAAGSYEQGVSGPDVQLAVVFDMSHLRVEVRDLSAVLRTSGGLSLASVQADEPGLLPVSGPAGRELMFDLFDRALSSTRLSKVDRDGVRSIRFVALYNPLSAELVVGGGTSAKAFSAARPAPYGVVLPAEGMLAEVGSDAVILEDGTELREAEATFGMFTRKLAAHAA